MRLTDTHCHLDLQAFDTDRDEVIARAADANVVRILVPSLSAESAERVVALAAREPRIFAAVGVHPSEIKDRSDIDLQPLQRLAADKKVVAIGEIGLDYYWSKDRETRENQQESLRKQLGLAAELDLPVVLHMREANDAAKGDCAVDMLRMLAEWVAGLRSSGAALADRPGVLHSFSGSREMALKLIEMGFLIGVTGPITYPKAHERRALFGSLPIERLLIETDSPYLAPQSRRGRRNEPALVTAIADRIAEVQSSTRDDVGEITSANAARLFGWGDPD